MKILIADDEYEWREPLSEMCRKAGHEVVAVSDGEDVLKMSESELRSFHAALLDYKMPTTGLEAGKRIKELSPDTLYMMLTAHRDTFTVEKAVEAMKEGFFDYISKSSDAYKEAMKQFLQQAENRSKINLSTQKQKVGFYRLDDIVGKCAAICGLKESVQIVAKTDTRVLVLGESGTGKELVAGAIHTSSKRGHKHYVRINCAAIPETLLESELFGHEKGAFTGAIKQKSGRVEEADGGTIFLDEIADMGKPLQAKLLRFLEDGTFTRVGGTEELRVDVRLIAATNRDIAKAIAAGDFREDLFHRLNVVQFNLPPLCERGQDIILLAEHFLQIFRAALNKHITGFRDDARQKLLAHRWPGNVRELRNAIERAMIFETKTEVQVCSLPDFQMQTKPHEKIVIASQQNQESILPSTNSPKEHIRLNAGSEEWKQSDVEKVREELLKYEDAYQRCKASGIKSPTFTDMGKLLVSREKNFHTEISNFFSSKTNRLGITGNVRVEIIKWLLRENPAHWPGLLKITDVSRLAGLKE